MKAPSASTFMLFAHALLAQHSQWVHPEADEHLVYGHYKSGTVIPDYSFAGYHSGGVAFPIIPAQIKLTPSGADDTVAIQHAIDAVSARPLDASGSRGAIELAPGDSIAPPRS